MKASAAAASTGQPDLPNDNFDTGEITGPGKYRLNDETHAKWLHALAKQNFSGASPEVRAELLEFFGHPDAPYATKRKPKDWAKVQAELEQALHISDLNTINKILENENLAKHYRAIESSARLKTDRCHTLGLIAICCLGIVELFKRINLAFQSLSVHTIGIDFGLAR